MCEFLDPNSVINLDKIKGTIMRKRLIRELGFLKEICPSITVSFDEDTDFPIVNVVNEEDNKINNISFKINCGYPFTPPSVIVNSQDYYADILKNNDAEFIKVLENLTGYHCLCCHSYICEKNWSPGVKLIDIVTEIRQNQKHKENVERQIAFDKLDDTEKNKITRDHFKI